MRANASQALPSSPSSAEDEDEGRQVSVKPSSIAIDEQASSKKKKNKDAPAQANLRLKRHGEYPFQESKKKKRSKKSLDNSGIDLEEFLAQTYPKQISATAESSKQTPTEGSGRRSNRKRKKPAKRMSDSAKKWSGDEEISLSMALLECSSSEGEINMAAFYQRAKESLHDEVSHSQLYDKMRTMKKRFQAIQSKLKEHNIAEDEFPYRTRQEPALFGMWKRIWGNNGGDHGINSENPNTNGVQGFEKPRANIVETPKESEHENSRGKGEEIGNENSMEIEGENPGEYDAETARERGAESPVVNDNARENSGETEAENPRGIEGENSGEIGSENPTRNEASKPRGNGIEKEKEGEDQTLQNSVSREKEGESNIQILLEKQESRLRASIESSINRVAVASAAGTNFQPFGGLRPDMGMGAILSRRMKELMDDLNSVKGIPGLDSVEARELQQKWHALKIQEVKMFCETLDLLQKQCRYRCKLTKLPWKLLTCRSCSTTGAMPLALWLEYLQMPRQTPRRLVAADNGATPPAATRTLRTRRLPTTTLPVVGLVAGGATLPPHPVVALAGPWLLLLVLVEIMLANGPAWHWRSLLHGLRLKMRRLPLIPLLLLLLMTAGLCPARPPIPQMSGVSMTNMIIPPWLPLLWQLEVAIYVFLFL